MFTSILQADLVSVISLLGAICLCGTLIICFFIEYSQCSTEETDVNPIDLFLALLAGEPYDTLPSPDSFY